VDLPFLRSVDRSRVSLKKARAAIALLEKGSPRGHLEKQKKRFVSEAEAKVERYLRKGDLARLIDQGRLAERAADHLMHTAFSRGVTADIVDAAYQPKSLNGALRGEVYRAWPELAACGQVCLPGGESVSQALGSVVRAFKTAVCAGVRKRFSPGRIRGLVSTNPSVKKLQKQADAALAGEKKLRTALLNAIPVFFGLKGADGFDFPYVKLLTCIMLLAVGVELLIKHMLDQRAENAED
jgi:hypothetical protein